MVFSLASSIVYIVNDLRDIDKDRQHPTKRNRPLASGRISPKTAYGILFFLILFTLLGNYWIAGASLLAWASLTAYVLMNLGYSMGLKNVALLDIFILMAGYVIRIYYGGEIVDVPVSGWLYLTVMSMAFYMGLGKRRNELVQQGTQTRNVLKFYTKDFLDKNMYVCLTMTIVFYSLWSMQISQERGESLILVTIPLVIILCMRYSLHLEQGSDGDPIEVVLGDIPLLLMGIAYTLLTGYALYGNLLPINW